MQFEILKELAEFRESNGDKFLKPNEVLELLKNKNYDVSLSKTRVCWALAKLEAYDYLEVKSDSMFWGRSYRIKDKYLEVFRGKND